MPPMRHVYRRPRADFDHRLILLRCSCMIRQSRRTYRSFRAYTTTAYCGARTLLCEGPDDRAVYRSQSHDITYRDPWLCLQNIDMLHLTIGYDGSTALDIILQAGPARVRGHQNSLSMYGACSSCPSYGNSLYASLLRRLKLPLLTRMEVEIIDLGTG